MQYDRLFDPDLIRATVTHPLTYRHVGDDTSPPAREYEPLIHDSIIYLGVAEEGRFYGVLIYVPHSQICWEIHCSLLPSAWGRAAELIRGAFDWLWENTRAQRIVARIAVSNRLAVRAAERAGMTQWGINPKSHLKNGELIDQVWLGVSRN